MPDQSSAAAATPVSGRTATGRRVAPGGWRRALVGLTVGVLAGLAAVRNLADDAR